MNARLDARGVAEKFFAPGSEDCEAEPLAAAVQAFRALGYDRLTIAGLFLQGAAVFAEPRMTPSEFSALARRYYEVTSERMTEVQIQVAS